MLDQNGNWMRVPYEGRECWFWRPTTVDAGWAPFTVGRWTEWYGDQTWIPAEPFGYVTHHYGAWVLVGDQWYWAPPVAAPGQPLLDATGSLRRRSLPRSWKGADNRCAPARQSPNHAVANGGDNHHRPRPAPRSSHARHSPEHHPPIGPRQIHYLNTNSRCLASTALIPVS